MRQSAFFGVIYSTFYPTMCSVWLLHVAKADPFVDFDCDAELKNVTIHFIQLIFSAYCRFNFSFIPNRNFSYDSASIIHDSVQILVL